MDAAALLPLQTRNPSKISGVFHRLAKACKLAAPTSFINPTASGTKVSHGSSSTDETEGSSEETHHSKIYPQPPSVALDESRASCSSSSDVGMGSDLSRVVLSQLLDAVSSLKLAYLEFQQAHVRFDAEKLRSADEALVKQLETVSDIELFYNEKRREKKKLPKPSSTKPASVGAARNAAATAAAPSCKVEVAEYQSLLEKLHAKIRAKDAEALQLRWAVEELRERNAEMEEEVIRTTTPEEEFQNLLASCRESTGSSCKSELLKLVHDNAAKSIHDFGKPLIGLMKACGWDLDLAAEAAMARTMRLSNGAVSFSERSHKKYVFEAYLSRILFTSPRTEQALSGVDDEEISRVMRCEDPLDTLAADPKSRFARFCSSKYLLAVHPAMERSFFGNLDQRAFVLRGGHPRTPFYRAFARMARWAWVLEALLLRTASGAGLVDGGSCMFWVESGRRFAEEHMKSICVYSDEDQEAPPPNSVVGFTVVPGFRFKEEGESVVLPCKVYVSR